MNQPIQEINTQKDLVTALQRFGGHPGGTVIVMVPAEEMEDNQPLYLAITSVSGGPGWPAPTIIRGKIIEPQEKNDGRNAQVQEPQRVSSNHPAGRKLSDTFSATAPDDESGAAEHQAARPSRSEAGDQRGAAGLNDAQVEDSDAEPDDHPQPAPRKQPAPGRGNTRRR